MRNGSRPYHRDVISERDERLGRGVLGERRESHGARKPEAVGAGRSDHALLARLRWHRLIWQKHALLLAPTRWQRHTLGQLADVDARPLPAGEHSLGDCRREE